MSFKFKRPVNSPLLRNWPNPEVIKTDNGFLSFADPGGYPIVKGESQWKSRQLHYAISKDGINCVKKRFLAPDSDVDACHVPQAYLRDKELYLFYSTQVGYSKNDGKYHYQYNRIRYRKYPVEIFF